MLLIALFKIALVLCSVDGTICRILASAAMDRRIANSSIADAYLAAGYMPIPLRYEPAYTGLILDMDVRGRHVAMLIDTGSGATLLDASVAKQFQLKLGREGAASGLVGANFQLREATISDVCLSRLCRASMRFWITDLKSRIVTQTYDRSLAPLGGLIGSDWLEYLSAIVDYSHRVLWIKNPAGADLYRLQGKWQAVELTEAGVKVTEPLRILLFMISVNGDAFRYTQRRYDVTPPKLHNVDSSILLNREKSLHTFTNRNVVVNRVSTNLDEHGYYRYERGRFQFLFPTNSKLVTTQLPPRIESTTTNGYSLFEYVRMPYLMEDFDRVLDVVQYPSGIHSLASRWLGPFTPKSIHYSLPGCRLTTFADGRSALLNTPGNVRHNIKADGQVTREIILTPANVP